MASFVAHNLHAPCWAPNRSAQRDLDTMQRFGDYRKPRDRGVPTYHAMLSEGGRVMHRFLGFLSTMILLLAMVNHAHADTGREDDEGLQARGEIDSSTVEVGALVVVVHGTGERHPVSREWAKLDTVKGYIKAVDQRRLIVGLEPDGWSKWIALERIQTMILVGSSSLGEVYLDRTQVDSSRAPRRFRMMTDRVSVKTERGDERETENRIAKKLRAGALGGSAFGFVSGSLMAGSVSAGGDGLGQPVVFYFFGLLGYTIGTAVGVSQVDPHDRFVPSLMGSLLGSLSGIGLASMAGSHNVLLVCPITSVALAVWMSEGSRNRSAERAFNPPEVSRFSIGLAPSPKGHLSAIAKLRF